MPARQWSGDWSRISRAEVHRPSSPRTCTGARSGSWASLGRKAVEPMPIGSVTPSSTTTSSVVPATASTTLPSQSVPIPYTYAVPGSATNGTVEALLPATTFGTPVTCCQRCSRSLQDQ